MSWMDINHAESDRSGSDIRAFILSQLGINHAGPDRAFSAIRTLILAGWILTMLGRIGHLAPSEL